MQPSGTFGSQHANDLDCEISVYFNDGKDIHCTFKITPVHTDAVKFKLLTSDKFADGICNYVVVSLRCYCFLLKSCGSQGFSFGECERSANKCRGAEAPWILNSALLSVIEALLLRGETCPVTGLPARATSAASDF